MLLALLLICSSSWELVADGPTRVERRRLDSGLYELRAHTRTQLPAQAVANAFWYRRAVRGVKKYVLIEQTEKVKLIYVQLKLPVIKDRDYTARIERYADEAAGLYQFETHCKSDAGPAPNDDHVRVYDCFGLITIERDESGATLITNVSSADPAGFVPHWIVNSLAPRAAQHFLDELTAEARRQQGAVIAPNK